MWRRSVKMLWRRGPLFQWLCWLCPCGLGISDSLSPVWKWRVAKRREAGDLREENSVVALHYVVGCLILCVAVVRQATISKRKPTENYCRSGEAKKAAISVSTKRQPNSISNEKTAWHRKWYFAIGGGARRINGWKRLAIEIIQKKLTLIGNVCGVAQCGNQCEKAWNVARRKAVASISSNQLNSAEKWNYFNEEAEENSIQWKWKPENSAKSSAAQPANPAKNVAAYLLQSTWRNQWMAAAAA